jgi:hypothetical protein
MVPKDLRPLFAGVDDEFLLFALHRRIRHPCDGVQSTFCLAWEGFEFIHSDGFEIVLGPNTALAECGKAFAEIGMPEAEAIFSQVLALISPNLLLPENEEALREYLQDHFDELQDLAYKFYDACEKADFVALASRYVRQHRDDFYQYVDESEPTDRAE